MSASTGTTVMVLVAVLVLLGVAMIGIAVWLVRTTRTDHLALGPLEVMGTRRWRRGDPARRQATLDTARPPGAPPPAPIVPFEEIGDDASAAAASAVAAANCEPSQQASAVPAHSSPVEAAESDPTPGNGDASVRESAVSGHSSGEEPTISESEVEANTTE